MSHLTARQAAPFTCVAAAFAVLAAGCTIERRSSPDAAEDRAEAPYQSEVDEGLGAAVAILIDRKSVV